MREIVLLGWAKHELCRVARGEQVVEMRCYFCHRTRDSGTVRVVDGQISCQPLELERFVVEVAGVRITCVVCRECLLVRQLTALRSASMADEVLLEPRES